MILGIDASNLRTGGGITHLVELLRHGQPMLDGFHRVVVWAGRATLDLLPTCGSEVELISVPALNGSLIERKYWQQVTLADLAGERCNVLFNPGGAYRGIYHPYVTMSRNLLPFQYEEMRRFAPSLVFFKLLLLRWNQARSMRHADGVIFLNDYARQTVQNVIPRLCGRAIIIPHGVDRRFFRTPRAQVPAQDFSETRPFRWLYVSTVDFYKHQWNVAEAVALLRQRGLPMTLDFYGAANPAALRRLQRVLARVDPSGRAIVYRGPARHSELPDVYHRADGFVYASSCENLPNTLLEAMAGGLPIACARRGPMPAMLQGGGVYFNPEQPMEIAVALEGLFRDKTLRGTAAALACGSARNYSWRRCTKATFRFLREVAESHANPQGPASERRCL